MGIAKFHLVILNIWLLDISVLFFKELQESTFVPGTESVTEICHCIVIFDSGFYEFCIAPIIVEKTHSTPFLEICHMHFHFIFCIIVLFCKNH